AATSGCADEPVVIGQASPGIETTQTPPAIGRAASRENKDTIAGLFGSHPGGSISWKLYDNKTCSSSEGGLVASDGPVAVSGNGDYSTPAGSSPTHAGTCYVVATYSCDANITAATSGCADEPVVIGQASPGIETTQTPP